MNDIRIEFKQTTVENLQAFSEILKKDINTMLEEALEQYFQSEQEKLLEKNQDDENAMTNLDYDEFWDGVDLDEG
jgi:tRNA A37 N6-isopentenylltransferase MiaA